MNDLNILDTSLRDGGHRTNFHFKNCELEAILMPLDRSGIELIEIGYRNGSLHPIHNLGRAGWCQKEYLLSCQALLHHAQIAVMAHSRNINAKDLLELKTCGVQLLRLCVAKNELELALPLIPIAKEIGLSVSVNFIHLSYYNETELDTVVDTVAHYQPDIIYFADSNGSLLPPDITAIYDKYISKYSIPFGFHAHDNIGLAQANALAAIHAGVRYIDASLAGMGKGTGNLKIEFFIAYLHAVHLKKYRLDDILQAANYVRKILKIGMEELQMGEFIRGISNLSTADLKLFTQNNQTPP